MEWWIPDLQGDLQISIAEAVTINERAVPSEHIESAEPSDNNITSGRIFTVEEYTESWSDYAG